MEWQPSRESSLGSCDILVEIFLGGRARFCASQHCDLGSGAVACTPKRFRVESDVHRETHYEPFLRQALRGKPFGHLQEIVAQLVYKAGRQGRFANSLIFAFENLCCATVLLLIH